MVKKADRQDKGEVIAYDCTINLHKRLHGLQFRNRAPKALKEIRKFATKLTHVDDVRVDPRVNGFVWHKGISAVPNRIRVRLEKKQNEDEEGEGKNYILVTHIPVKDYKGLENAVKRET